MSENKVLRPTFTTKQLKIVCKSLYFYKKTLEKLFNEAENYDVIIELNEVTRLLVNLLHLIHGKKTGRRLVIRGCFKGWQDDVLEYFGLVRREWLEELQNDFH